VRRSRYPSASPARPSLEKQASLARVMSQAALGLRFMLTARLRKIEKGLLLLVPP
jgi:hypothetical protein